MPILGDRKAFGGKIVFGESTGTDGPIMGEISTMYFDVAQAGGSR